MDTGGLSNKKCAVAIAKTIITDRLRIYFVEDSFIQVWPKEFMTKFTPASWYTITNKLS